MTRYVAFLRGINVGKAKQIPMADLRTLLTELGYTDVATLLRSGNAVFTGEGDPAEVANRMEKAVEATFGMTVGCVVRDGADLAAVIAANPFPEAAEQGSRYLAHFLSAAPDPALVEANDPVELDPDRIRLGDRVIYQWCPDGIMAAPDVGTYAVKNLGVVATGRNWNTLTKLAAMLGA
ncbi:MAG: DUF1697 domain-containing protein [Streptosporangiales bacterium]|nr:DUF1697 domain-containing protein [Streptosporangiales bacterium]MBO0890015.1 DUF1697 domain-containing protein [Acidothermales bacterium]